MEAAIAGANESTPKMFLRARFEIPCASGENDCEKNEHTISSLDIVEQYFGTKNCSPAVIGLPHGVEPIKPEPGDYSYSGMHDQGPLPELRGGGQFSQIIGFVEAAKKASDYYLSEIIDKEKSLAKSHETNVETANNHNQKRKRK